MVELVVAIDQARVRFPVPALFLLQFESNSSRIFFWPGERGPLMFSSVFFFFFSFVDFSDAYNYSLFFSSSAWFYFNFFNYYHGLIE